MNLSLEGRNAIVCGSSQGIGFAIAEELAIMGANCILLARNEHNLKTAVSQLDISIRQSHKYYSVDFNELESVRSLIKKIVSEQTIHILINNSGGPNAGPITDATEEEFLQAFNQHLIVSHILTTSVTDGMKKDGYGRIINILSTSVKTPLNNLGVSNTIRWSVAAWSKTLANELGQFGITVNNVLPGATATERNTSLIEANAKRQNATTDEIKETMIKAIPAKRFGEPVEIAAVAAFLATPAASYVNGVSIPVDGGRTPSI